MNEKGLRELSVDRDTIQQWREEWSTEGTTAIGWFEFIAARVNALLRKAGPSEPRSLTMERARNLARSYLYGAMGYLGISELKDKAVEAVASRLFDDFRAGPSESGQMQVDNTASITIRGQEQVAVVMKALYDAGFVTAQSVVQPAKASEERQGGQTVTQTEIVQEMEVTKAAIELIEQLDPGDKDGLAAMRARMNELCELVKDRKP